jgi:hypothetical protein
LTEGKAESIEGELLAAFLVSEIGPYHVAIEAQHIARILRESELTSELNCLALPTMWRTTTAPEPYVVELLSPEKCCLILGAQTRYLHSQLVPERLPTFLEGLQEQGLLALLLLETETLYLLDPARLFQ